MICLAAILTEHYFFNGIFIDGKKKWHIKRIKTNLTTLRKRCALRLKTTLYPKAGYFSNKADDSRKLFTIIYYNKRLQCELRVNNAC